MQAWHQVTPFSSLPGCAVSREREADSLRDEAGKGRASARASGWTPCLSAGLMAAGTSVIVLAGATELQRCYDD